MQRELDSLQLEQRVKAPAMLSETEKAIQTTAAEIEATKRKIASLQKERIQTVNELTKGLLFFKSRLGLEFTCEKGKLRLAFQWIDPAAPARQFCATVALDSSTGKYKVEDCQPALSAEQLGVWEEELAESNDFSAFVKKLRRGFKQWILQPAEPLPVVKTPARSAQRVTDNSVGELVSASARAQVMTAPRAQQRTVPLHGGAHTPGPVLQLR